MAGFKNKACFVPIIGVIGGSRTDDTFITMAYEVGKLIAKNGWILLTGGLGGVMEEASRGAYDAGGLVVGILPNNDKKFSNPFVHVPIVTNMGHARNVILAHTADALVAVDGEYGTLSEIAIGLKIKKYVLSLRSFNIEGAISVKTPLEAVELLREHFKALVSLRKA